MKKRRKDGAFIDELRRMVRTLKKMKAGEVHIMSINANYGHYQIVIGPEEHEVGPHRKGHDRPIEINGEIHHLFVSPRTVTAYPSKHEVLENLKHTVIMRDLSVHLLDPKGDGQHLTELTNGGNGIHAREYINLAGSKGKKLIEKVEHSDKLSLDAYRIVQKDILRALKEHKK